MSEPEQSVRTVAEWLRAWPDWLLVISFVVLAIAFALAGKLDDWLRVLAGVTFLAISVTLVARWRMEHPGPGRPDNPEPPPDQYP